MTWRENIERVREALNPVYTTPARFEEALEALAVLTAQIEELERERDKFDSSNRALYEHLALAKNRVEAAEQRVEELEDFVEWAIGKSFDPDSGPWQDKFLQRARAALAQSDPPEN